MSPIVGAHRTGDWLVRAVRPWRVVVAWGSLAGELIALGRVSSCPLLAGSAGAIPRGVLISLVRAGIGM